MSLTARHKKLGGFKKLVNSLEITPPEKRGKILDLMREEDPTFVAEVEKNIFHFEEFKNLPDMMLSDVVHHLRSEMKYLVLALHKSDEELVNKFKKCMHPVEASLFKAESELWTQVKISEQMGARFRIIEKARSLQEQGVIVLKRYDSMYA